MKLNFAINQQNFLLLSKQWHSMCFKLLSLVRYPLNYLDYSEIMISLHLAILLYLCNFYSYEDLGKMDGHNLSMYHKLLQPLPYVC